MKETTSYPNEPMLDYNPTGYLARVAFPDKETGAPRIWIKGSAAYPLCRVGKERIKLEPPYYTRLLPVSADSVEVVFMNEEGNDEGPVRLFPKSAGFFKAKNRFSIMAYGCFQPFHVNEETGEPVVRGDSLKTEQEIREVFKEVALGMNLRFRKSQDSLATKGKLLHEPLAVFGTGDQTYVDASYYTPVEKNPMTAWSTGKNPRPLLSPREFQEHMNRMYLHFGSFRVFDEVLHRLPFAAVWDDHEIRDGWGSQGDEYPENAKGFDDLNPELAPYFFHARDAYIKHQYLLGPRRMEEIDSTSGLYQHMKINGVACFLMDLRSHRNIHQKQAMSIDQEKAFGAWLNGLDSGQTAVIVSSVPLFWEAPQFVEGLVKTMKEAMEDDVMDAWSSDANVEQRNRIYSMLLGARLKKNIKPVILSGDIHVGAVNEVWYNPSADEERKEILAYEMVVSGLAHRSLHEQSWSKQLTNLVSSDGVLATELAPGDDSVGAFDISVGMRLSAAKLNFGAVEVEDSTLFLNLFFKDTDRMVQFKIKADWNGAATPGDYQLEEVKGESGASTFITSGKDVEQRLILRKE